MCGSSAAQADSPLPSQVRGGCAGVVLHRLTLPSHHLACACLPSAQAEADDAARRLDALERELAAREAELAQAEAEVAKAEAAAAAAAATAPTAAAAGAGAAAAGAPPATAAVAQDALSRLAGEERELLARMAGHESRPMFEAFLSRRAELEAEEARLTAALAEHEETLAQVRALLTHCSFLHSLHLCLPACLLLPASLRCGRGSLTRPLRCCRRTPSRRRSTSRGSARSVGGWREEDYASLLD